MPMFTRLRVWRAAHELSLDVYRVTANFPKYEIYGLSAQVRGAAASVGANIAEGQRRGTARQFIAFLRVAQGSLAETQHFVILARDLGYLNQDDYARLDGLATEVEKMLVAFQKRLREQLAAPATTPAPAPETTPQDPPEGNGALEAPTDAGEP